MNDRPVKIEKIETYFLRINWSDGLETTISLKDFREGCPCAECNNEDPATKKYGFKPLKAVEPGRYELEKIQVVGNYAISPKWKDGHDTGIYDYGMLRKLFEDKSLSETEMKVILKKFETRNGV